MSATRVSTKAFNMKEVKKTYFFGNLARCVLRETIIRREVMKEIAVLGSS